MAGVLAGMLSGCAGGEGQAKAADQRFVEVTHVVDASTVVQRAGSPFNTQYNTDLTLESELTASEQAGAIDAVLVIAREELAPTANVGFVLHIVGGSRAIDMEQVIPALGGVGEQISDDLQTGQLRLTQDVLTAYVSPSEGS
jgi:hypothetical protein